MLPPVLVLTRRQGAFFGTTPGGGAARPGSTAYRTPTFAWGPATAAETQRATPQLVTWATATRTLQANSRNGAPTHLAMWYGGGWYYAAIVAYGNIYFFKSTPWKNVGANPPSWPAIPPQSNILASSSTTPYTLR